MSKEVTTEMWGILIKSERIVSIILILSVLSACQSLNLSDLQNITTVDETGIAAQFCEQNGGIWQIRTNAQDENLGACVFEDKSECEGNAFLRGECRPGQYFASQAPLETQGLANMPNPASQHCEQNGGTLQLRLDANGGQYGMCVFADGSECEEWAFYRGECRPANSPSSPGPGALQGPANMPNPASQNCEQNGGTLQLRLDANGGQYGVCVFADGSECEEWAFYRGECRPGNGQPQSNPPSQHTYTNAAFGFSLDAPAGWTVWDAPNLVQFQRQAYTLFIGYWPANQTPPQIRAGMPAGEVKDAGQYNLAGSMFQKRYIIQQGKVNLVDFGHGLGFGPLQFSIWLEGPPGQGKNQSGEIPQEIIAEAEAILSSLILQP